MSQIPRRTNEFQGSSVRKSANPRSSRVSQTSLRLPRFSQTPSRNRMTPLRTPNRSNSKDRATLIPMTAEKEKAPIDDKVFIQNATTRIIEELARLGNFNDLIQKGLKSMTHKQFFQILQLVMKPFVGDVKIDASESTDYIYNTILQLGYPYTINKSSLKTPTAPHSYNSIIVLLVFLIDLNGIDEEEEGEHYVTEDFETPEASKLFMQLTAEAFDTWNSQQDSELDYNEEIKRTFIRSKIGPRNDPEKELKKLKESVENLRNEPKPVCHEKDLNEKRDESKLLKQRFDQLSNCNNELLGKANDLQRGLDMKRASVEAASKELKATQTKLAKQKMTLDQKDQLLKEISEAKEVLRTKKEQAMTLAEESCQKEIVLSILIQRKILLVEKLNNALHLVSCNIAGMHAQFDPAKYEFPRKTGDSFEADIEKFKEGHRELKQKYQQKISEFDKMKVAYDSERIRLQSETEMLETKCGRFQAVLAKLSEEIKMRMADFHHVVTFASNTDLQNQTTIDKMNSAIETLNYNIALLTSNNAELKKAMSEFKVKAVEKCKHLYEKRKREAEEKRKMLNEMKQFITEYEKKKNLPANVQKTVDEVMKKRGLAPDDREN